MFSHLAFRLSKDCEVSIIFEGNAKEITRENIQLLIDLLEVQRRAFSLKEVPKVLAHRSKGEPGIIKLG